VANAQDANTQSDLGAKSDVKAGLTLPITAELKKNLKAAMQAKGLDKQHIRFDAKNGESTPLTQKVILTV